MTQSVWLNYEEHKSNTYDHPLYLEEGYGEKKIGDQKKQSILFYLIL